MYRHPALTLCLACLLCPDAPEQPPAAAAERGSAETVRQAASRATRSAPAETQAEPPVRIIFDTDMDTDCDDAGALAVLHALADRGEVEILATPVSSKHRWSGACVDAINTFFGRPDLAIGVPKGPGAVERGSKYARQIAAAYPHDFPTDDPPDATAVYRRILAGQPDGSVVIVTVGYLTNLRYLLDSGGDEISPLSGRDMVREKVKRWVCMGSRYPADRDPAVWGNFKPDAASAVRAVEGWPGPIVFTGGGAFARAMATGRGLAALPAADPVRRVYELYFGGRVKDRHSADPIAVLVAARGTGRPWRLVTKGHNHLFPNGTHEWRKEPDHPSHAYISALADGVAPHDVAARIETLMTARRRRTDPGR